MSNENRKRVEEIYAQQRNYIVIGLTGRHGSGCSTICSILEDGLYDPNDYLGSSNTQDITNNDRDQEIILNFMNSNMVKFDVIRVRDILTMFILEEPGAFYCLLKECKEEKSEDNINALKEEFFRYFRENGEALLGKEEEELKQRSDLFAQAQSIEDINQGGDPNDFLDLPAPEEVSAQSTALPGETSSETVAEGGNQSAVAMPNFENPFVVVAKKWSSLWEALTKDFEEFIRQINQEQWKLLTKDLGGVSDLIRKYLLEKCSAKAPTIVFQRVGNMVRTFGK